MGRRFAVGVAGFVAFLTVGGFCALWFATRPAHRINESAVKQIGKGMTFTEVEAILGVPAGDYSTQPFVFLGSPQTIRDKVWISDDACIRIWFDENDRVLGVVADPIMFPDESRWQSFRRWFRRQIALQ